MRTNRPKISLNTDAGNLAMLMGERNPGGLSVAVQLLHVGPQGIGTLLSLDDMNIRGCQLWEAFKFAGDSIPKLIELAKARSPELVAAVNRECSTYGHRAVECGASFDAFQE